MRDRDAVRPEHDSGVPSTASNSTPQAPDEPIGDFETGNDPTGGSGWIRRRFRLDAGAGDVGEAIDALLRIPGVARASRDDATGEIVADVEPGVVSDDELTAALGRGGVDVLGWADEDVPPSERRTGGDEPIPRSTRKQSEIVDEESDDSFPASDAPSSWARPPDGP